MIAFDAAITARDIAEVEANITGNGPIAVARRLSLTWLTFDSTELLRRCRQAAAIDSDSEQCPLMLALQMASDFVQQTRGALELAEASFSRLCLAANEIAGEQGA